jgi:hypothetical protein
MHDALEKIFGKLSDDSQKYFECWITIGPTCAVTAVYGHESQENSGWLDEVSAPITPKQALAILEILKAPYGKDS